jgi:hypothetical protein
LDEAVPGNSGLDYEAGKLPEDIELLSMMNWKALKDYVGILLDKIKAGGVYPSTVDRIEVSEGAQTLVTKRFDATQDELARTSKHRHVLMKSMASAFLKSARKDLQIAYNAIVQSLRYVHSLEEI